MHRRSVRLVPALAAVPFVAVLVVADPASAQVRPPAATPPLDTIVAQVVSRVSPGLSTRTRTVEVITAAEIERIPARSFGDLLRWANGVDLQQRSGGQADISLRGAGFEQVLVLVDGVRVSDSQSGHFDLDLAVPLDRIERIEILRGPASALFGADAVGGVVNVVTRAPGPLSSGSTARLEGGSFGSLRATATQAYDFDGTRLTVGGEWAESDGDREGTDFENRIVQGTLETPVAGGILGLSGGYAARDFGAADFYAPIPAYEETRTARGVAEWRSGPLSSGYRAEARASYRDHEDLFVFFRDDPESGRNVHDASQAGVEVVVRRRSAGSRLSYALGAEAWEDELQSSNLGERSETRTALFGEAVIEAGSRAVLTLGARGDSHDVFGDFFSPTVSASYDLTPTVRLKGSVARSFRAPTWTERYYVDGFHQASSEIDPERSWSYEAGFRLSPSGRWSVGVAGFLNQTEDLIDWAKPDGSGDEVKWVTRNVKEADFMGVELDAEVADYLGASWKVGASLLDLEARGDGGFFSKRALHPEAQRVSVAVVRPLEGGLELAARGLHAKRVGQETYHQVDLRLSAPVGRGVLYFDVVNLTDQDYLDASAKPVAGTGFFLGYRLGG